MARLLGGRQCFPPMTAQVPPLGGHCGVECWSHWDMLQEVLGRGLMETSFPQHLKGKIARNVHAMQVFCPQGGLLGTCA